MEKAAKPHDSEEKKDREPQIRRAGALKTYTVQEGDTCTRIFLLTGVPIDQIIALNNLDDDCNVFPEQELLLGIVEVSTATPIGLCK